MYQNCFVVRSLFSGRLAVLVFGLIVSACGDTDSSELSNSLNVSQYITPKGHLTEGYESELRQRYAGQPHLIKLIDATKSLVGTPYSKMDCSKFAKTVYESAGLSYSKGSTQIPSNELAKGDSILESFMRFDVKPADTVAPVASDLLGWPAGANGAESGHVVVVIDPDNCVIAHSASWMWDNGLAKASGIQGVAFNKIESSSCSKGAWKKLNNRVQSTWTFQLRHKN